MTARRFFVLILFVALLLSGFNHVLFSEPTAYDRLKEQLTEARGTFDKWSVYGTIIVILTCLIGILGALAGLMAQKWGKWKIAFGFCVTILTVINSTVFEADYRTYWRLSDEGHDLAWKVDIDLASYQEASDADRLEFFQSIQENFGKMKELKQTLHGLKPGSDVTVNQMGGVLTSVAFAAGGQPRPTWVTRLPSDGNSIYCVGVDYDNSIKLATLGSLEDARRNCMSYLLLLFEGAAPSSGSRSKYQDIASFIVSSRSVRVADTYYEYDVNTRRYTYYTLLQVQRELAQNDVAFFTETKQQSSMQQSSLPGLIMKAPGLPEDFYWKREQEFRKRIPFATRLTDLQKRLWYAIGLRKGGNLKQASTEFSYIVKKDSNMVEGWYNLALTAEGQKDSSGAAKAYTRGMRVAERKKIDHPYLNRDFGLWLYKNASIKNALEYLRRFAPPVLKAR
ncbi:MAG: hypothetical protein HW407_1641 [Bacteroidetes bacterium]|nr:hypothetical protein [Bacteroidota bacterium]